MSLIVRIVCLFGPASGASINTHLPHVAVQRAYITLASSSSCFPLPHNIRLQPPETTFRILKDTHHPCSSFSYSSFYVGDTGQAPRPSSTPAHLSTMFPSSSVTTPLMQMLAGRCGTSSGAASQRRSQSHGFPSTRTCHSSKRLAGWS